MNEKTFYRDAENSFERCPVAVETGLLRVQNDSYSLDGVRDAKLQVTLAPYDLYSSKAFNEKRTWACICAVIAVVGSMLGQNLFLLFGIGTVVVGYFAVLSKEEAEAKREFVARIILLRADGETPVKVGYWHRSPNDLSIAVIARLGCDADQ